ncbi:MAG TPA: CocE/NonD family hydrolase, partial [Chloroflexota bacterium]|nr:CocE/NonD family hydrolase [Chloroflexota bacterium]
RNRMAGYAGSAQGYDVTWERDVMIPMRDGIRLATDIYFPASGEQPADGKFPVIVERTPYDKRGLALVATAKFFARHGYVCALQDVRGRFNSEGEWYAFAKEGPDGYDTVEWLGTQAWSTGKVGTIGGSYAGSDQHALANLNPPHLAAMVPYVAMHNYHTNAMRQGGCMELRFYSYAFRMATTSKEALADEKLRAVLEDAHANVGEWFGRLPMKKGVSPLRHLPSYEQWVYDVMTHGDYDDYWQQPGYNVEEYWDHHANVPMLLVGAWYDTYTRSTCANFVQFTERGKGPCRLLLGPWTHGGHARAHSGDADFGIDAPLDDYNGHRLRWFDYWLKGIDTGLKDEPPVRIFIMGTGDGRKTVEGRLNHGGSWRAENEWPLARTQWTRFYLHPEGGLATELPPESRPSGYRYDPGNPVPTVGGNISAAETIMPAGGYDQRGGPGVFGAKDRLPLAARRDVLVFSGAPLEADLEITGPLEVKLWAASSAVDTDFTAKLIDWYPPSPDYPDGYALNLEDSIIRARYRNDRSKPELMTPGEVYPFTIVPFPTSNVFKKGHRIRLDISSSNWPRFDVNPNTGEPIAQQTRQVVADQLIYHDPSHPSHVVLPVIPG